MMALDVYNKPVSVTSQCLAIVLCKPDGRELSNNSGTQSARANRDGQKIFAEFQNENRDSFWNPALVESVLSLDYVGFMRPGTLLVSASELYLECLRGAWARRVLKPPRGYRIKSLGDVGGIEMQAVPQTQFIPLPEVLCLLISSQNRSGQPATAETLTFRLQEQYAGMTIPRGEVLLAALGALVAEGKVYCMGDHYFLSTPLMYQQYQAALMQQRPPEFAYNTQSHGRQSAKYQQTPDMCSIECQTGASIVNAVPAYKPTAGKGNNSKKDQATSAQEKKMSPDLNNDGLTRSRSLKEKNSEQAKDKQGFFARLFRRSKSREAKVRNKKEKEDQNAPPSKSKDSPEKVCPLSTFSAQFPPPEWIHDPRHVRQATHHGQPLFFKNRKSRNEKSEKQTAMKADRHSIWIDLEPSSRGSRRSRNCNEFRSTSKKYSTVPENLATGVHSPKIERVKHSRKHRLSKYMSSSSEALHYLGPIDRPTHLELECESPNVSRGIRHSNRPRYSGQRRNSVNHPQEVNLDQLPVSERVRSGSSSKRSSGDERKPKKSQHQAPLAAPTGSDLDTTAEMTGDRSCSTPAADTPKIREIRVVHESPRSGHIIQHSKQNSDSALSASPVVTEMSSTSNDSNKYSSWSGSEGQQPRADPDGRDPMDHTYINVNMNDEPPKTKQTNLKLPSPIAHFGVDRTYENINRHLESTQFENVTDLDLDSSLEENHNSVPPNLRVSKTIVITQSPSSSKNETDENDNSKTKKNGNSATTYISAV